MAEISKGVVQSPHCRGEIARDEGLMNAEKYLNEYIGAVAELKHLEVEK